MTRNLITGLNAKETAEIKARLAWIAEELEQLDIRKRQIQSQVGALRNEQARLNATVYRS